MGSGPLSQADLAAAFKQTADDAEALGRNTPGWIEGGSIRRPRRCVKPGEGVIREEDRVACTDRRGNLVPREITRYTIPMPLKPVSRRYGVGNS